MKAVGLDGHNGAFFPEFTRGETVPFSFQITDDDDQPKDITGWMLYVAMTTSRSCYDANTPEIDKAIAPQDAPNGIFSGEITDDETFGLAAGTVYGSIRVIDNNGRAFVVDKARLTVGECVSPRRVQ